MRELLYVPLGQVSSTGAVGLLIPEFGNPIFAALAQAMEMCAGARSLATILCNTAGSPAREAEYVHMLLERKVDGMIFVSAEVTDTRTSHAHYAQLRDRGANFIFVNGYSESLDVPSVGVDERAAGRMATEYLLDLGHRRIGFLGGDVYAQPTRQKALGREDALRDAGVEPDGLVAHAGFTVTGGREALRALVASAGPGRPTAVTCSNDLMAIGAMLEARALGLRVPEDFSIVGFDGIDAASWTQPPLTTVVQPIESIAATAVDALCARLDAPSQTLPNYVFRPKLRRGGTTAPPSGAD